ncbi:MAG: hypothetical protein J7L14_03675 [Candidatus Diapherotrites archaeon]|nr:hypothetical protein [Candidatus Diapherotrites archaeon]
MKKKGKKRIAIFEYRTKDNYTKRADFVIPKGNLSMVIYQNWDKWVNRIQSDSPVAIKTETIKFIGTVYD